MKKTRKFLLIMMVLLLLISGCNKESGDLPKKIKIGTIRVPNDKTVALEKKYFDEFFKDRGIETEFIFFDSGTSVNQAFSSGALDFAEMGFTNAVVALSNNLEVELIWIHEILGTNEALVARDGKEIKSISDLKGKKIATPFSSTSHLSLLKALEKEGISEQDIHLLDMDTADIVAAWERGDLDAAYTWEPSLSKIMETGTVIVDSKELAEKGIVTANVDLAHKNFTSKYPELTADYITALSKSKELLDSKPEEAIQAAADRLDIKFDDAKRQIEGTIWLSREEEISEKYLGGQDSPGDFHRIFLETSDFLYNQNKISKKLDIKEVNEFINSSYIEKSLEKIEVSHE